jgi:hypothetical protein
MYHELHKRHAGKTIFLIGAGPSLGKYNSDLLQRLGERVCIGVNRTQYKVHLSYFVSSYLSEVLLALKRQPSVYAINTRPVQSTPPVAGIHPIRRIYSENVADFVATLSADDPHLVTRNNVMFLASNLALVMGAANIVYVGCEMRNGLHFYNEDDSILAEIITDLCSIVHEYKHLMGRDHPYENPRDIMRSLTTSADKLKSRPPKIDHAELLSKWIGRLKQEFGLGIYCCAYDSVFVDAGAGYVDLETALCLR